MRSADSMLHATTLLVVSLQKAQDTKMTDWSWDTLLIEAERFDNPSLKSLSLQDITDRPTTRIYKTVSVNKKIEFACS